MLQPTLLNALGQEGGLTAHDFVLCRTARSPSDQLCRDSVKSFLHSAWHDDFDVSCLSNQEVKQLVPAVLAINSCLGLRKEVTSEMKSETSYVENFSQLTAKERRSRMEKAISHVWEQGVQIALPIYYQRLATVLKVPSAALTSLMEGHFDETTLDSNDPKKCLSMSDSKKCLSMSDFISAVKHQPTSNTEDSENQEDRTVLINEICCGMGDLGSLLDPEILYDKWVDAITRDANTKTDTAGSKDRSETSVPDKSDYEADKELNIAQM